MIENPVKSPMVPPIADSISTNLAALSFVTLSKTGVSKGNANDGKPDATQK